MIERNEVTNNSTVDFYCAPDIEKLICALDLKANRDRLDIDTYCAGIESFHFSDICMILRHADMFGGTLLCQRAIIVGGISESREKYCIVGGNGSCN